MCVYRGPFNLRATDHARDHLNPINRDPCAEVGTCECFLFAFYAFWHHRSYDGCYRGY